MLKPDGVKVWIFRTELEINSYLSLLDSDADADRAAELAKVTAYPQGPTRKLKADESHIFNGIFIHAGFTYWILT